MTIKIQGTNSTAAPGITGGDTDTGVQFGTNEVKIVTDGTDRVIVDSTGASTFNKVLKVNRTASGDGCFHAALNGTVKASIASDGSATFDGEIDAKDKLDVTHSTTNANSFIQRWFSDVGGTNTQQAVMLADGRLQFRSGAGIDFSTTADGSGTMTSELLDDYEEGTWTPTLPMGGTISVQGTKYTKIGRQVLLYMYTNISGTPNNNSEFQIGGLPYQAAGASYFPSGNIGFSSTFNMDPWRPLVRGGTSVIYFHRVDGTSVTARNSDVTSLGEIVITIAYCV